MFQKKKDYEIICTHAERLAFLFDSHFPFFFCLPYFFTIAFSFCVTHTHTRLVPLDLASFRLLSFSQFRSIHLLEAFFFFIVFLNTIRVFLDLQAQDALSFITAAFNSLNSSRDRSSEMNISIGSSSSSSYSSERSPSSPRPAYRHGSHHHHRRRSRNQDGVHDETQQMDTAMLVFDLEDEAQQQQQHHRQYSSSEKGTDDAMIDLYGEHVRQHQSSADDYADVAEFDAVPTTPTAEAHQRSEDLFDPLPSRDSISPRYTPSNSLPRHPFSPSITSSSLAPAAPPPLPPSPQSMVLAQEAQYRRAPTNTSVTTSQGEMRILEREDEKDGGGGGYLRRADAPADSSSPPFSPQQSTAASAAQAFTRTASPSPLRRTTAADTSATADFSAAAPSSPSSSIPNAPSMVDALYEPLQAPTLRSLTQAMEASSEVGLCGGGGGGGAEGPPLPSRAAPPLPRPTGPPPPPPPPPSSSFLLPPHQPSRSVDSALSVSLPRAAEPRVSIGRHAEEEVEQEGREAGVTLGSVSGRECSARAPSHAPTLRLHAGVLVKVEEEKERSAPERVASISQQRGPSSMGEVSAGSSSCSRPLSMESAENRAAAEDERPERRPQQQQLEGSQHGTRQKASPSSPTSPRTSASASSEPSPAAASPSSSVHLNNNSTGMKAQSATPDQSTGDCAMDPAVVSLPRRHLTVAAEDVSEVSSIAVLTPADTAISSSSVGGGSRQMPTNSMRARQPLDKQEEAEDESPPPLPPAPRRATAATHGASQRAPKTQVMEGHHADVDNRMENAVKAADAADNSPNTQRHTALDRWRSGAMEEVADETPTRPTLRAEQRRREDVAPTGAITYKGGVDFVRWVPSSIPRDAEVAGTARAPPHGTRALPSNTTAATGTHAHSSHTTDTGGDPNVKLIAVPLVPSPLRAQHRSGVTAAVLAEVARRRASPPAVHNGGGAVVAAAAATRPQRLRFSTITSPQLARDAQRLALSHASPGEKASAAPLNDVRRYGWSAAPTDAWSQQPRGRFLSNAAPPFNGEAAEGTPSAKAALGPNVRDRVPEKQAVCDHRQGARNSVEEGRSAWQRARPPQLETTLASRSLTVSSLTNVGSQRLSSHDTYDENRDDTNRELPTVVRAWRPLSALMRQPHDEKKRLPFTHGPASTAAARHDAPLVAAAPLASAAAAALSIDVSDSMPASLVHRTHNTADAVEDAAPASARLTAAGLSTCSTAARHVTPTPAAGYAAIYSPRTLATRVLRARDALLPVASPSSFSVANGAPAMGALRSVHSPSSYASFSGPAVAGGGSRVTPAIGAAVAASAASPRRQSLMHATPPHVHVDLSRATPLRGPPVAEVLANSYDDTQAVTNFASAPPIGALARQAGERVAAAVEREPWSLFLERDSGDAGVAAAAVAQDAWQPPLRREEVARHIPFDGADSSSRGAFTRIAERAPRDVRGRDGHISAGDGAENDYRSGNSSRGIHGENSMRFPAPSTPSEAAATNTSTVRPSESASITSSAASSTHRPSTTTSTAAAAAAYASGEQDRLRARALRNLQQSQLVEQQRLVQEEGFRRRQIVMAEAHTFSIEMTELNYRRAVSYVQHAAATTAGAGALVAAPAAPPVRFVHVGTLSSQQQQQQQERLAGLSAVRQDQAAMAASLGHLSRELDLMSL